MYNASQLLDKVQAYIAGLAYSANGSEVETVIIDGKITMENRQVLTMDEEKIYYEINRIISRMGLDKKVY